jgi:hypothetical protein
MRAYSGHAQFSVMNNQLGRIKWSDASALMVGLVVGLGVVQAADFTVTTPGGQFLFVINGSNSPALTLVRGQTYTFAVQTSANHPFHIESPGVQNNDITTGVITYTVPTNAINYSYSCVIHPWMFGDIVTVEPPSIQIFSLAVGSNLVLTSTAPTNWVVQPEFSTNLLGTNWYALTVQTNRPVNDKLETICGRPEGDSVFVRLKASR